MEIFEISEDGFNKLKDYTDKLKNKNNYCIQIIKKEVGRKLEQNRWYWGYVLPSILFFSKDDFTGYNTHALHEHIKLVLSNYVPEYQEFLYEVNFNGKTLMSTRLSTKFTEMNKDQFETYLKHLLEYISVYINFPISSLGELVMMYCSQADTPMMCPPNSI